MFFLNGVRVQGKSSSSSSSCRTIRTDIPDPLSPPLPIVHCFRQVLRATSRIGTELLYVCLSWSSCICTSMWRDPQEYITYHLDHFPGFLAGPSGISTEWVVEINGRFEAERPPNSAGPPSGERATSSVPYIWH